MNKKVIYFISVLTFFAFASCQSARKYKDSLVEDGTTCSGSLEQIKKKTDIGSLNLIRDMYFRSCFEETIQAVSYARQQFRDSVLSVTRDAAEMVVFEGTFVDYTMESYERTYLALLAVRSYMNLQKTEDAIIELRNAYRESVAQLDTYGQDRITIFLMAALWEKLGRHDEAEPLYRRILELSGKNKDSLFLLAKTNLDQTDRKKSKKFFVYELGALPELQLGITSRVEFRYPPFNYEIKRGQQAISYTHNMIPACQDNSSVVISTQEWLRFLTDRIYYSDNAKYKIKKMARLPLTIFYSTTVFAAGAYVTALGANDPRMLLAGAVGTITATGLTYSYGMAPDLRYWDRLPQAMIISDHEIVPYDLECLQKFKDQKWLKPKKFL